MVSDEMEADGGEGELNRNNGGPTRLTTVFPSRARPPQATVQARDKQLGR